MKLLIDVNLSPAWERFLRQHLIEAVHWSQVGKNTASDYEILTYAAEFGYTILTRDLDFGNILLARNLKVPSVIQFRSGDVRPEVLGEQFLLVLDEAVDQLHEGAILTVSDRQSRLTLLPLRRKRQ